MIPSVALTSLQPPEYLLAAKAHVQVWFAERLYQTHLLLHPDF